MFFPIPGVGAGRVCLARRSRARGGRSRRESVSAVAAHHRTLDLKNFERHRAKLKVGFEF